MPTQGGSGPPAYVRYSTDGDSSMTELDVACAASDSAYATAGTPLGSSMRDAWTHYPCPRTWSRDLPPVMLAELYTMQIFKRCHLHGNEALHISSTASEAQQKRDNRWVLFQHCKDRHVHAATPTHVQSIAS